MRIAIHHRPGSFSDRWISYCEKKSISYKIVNAFDSEIVGQLSDCDALMWHHHHSVYKDVVAAKKILFALEHAGIKVFPDFKTGWHFDDKVAQKYLLEAIGAPLVPSYVFYSKQEALDWAKIATFPTVFKLKGGAGGANVRLVHSEAMAKKLINKAFRKGFSQYNRFAALKERFRQYRQERASLFHVMKGVGRLFIQSDFAKQQPNEKGYVYFQDFVPDNNSDLRVIVIGDKAFAVKRLVRENDFRASGSGAIEFRREVLDEQCVKLAFDVNKALGAQTVAYDFIFDDAGIPLIVEICYGFAVEPYDNCPGYWDKELNWFEGRFVPQEWMVNLVIQEAASHRRQT